MKKHIATVALAGVLALGVVGCGQQQSTSQSTAETTAQSTAETTAQSTAQSTAETTAQPAAEKTEQVNWTDAENADKAAEGAKLVKFGVPGDITVDDVKYENAKFAYSDGTAQATYIANASSLIVRKANKDSKVAVTPLDTASAAASWIKSYEDIDVTCYGPAKGAAYAIIFRDGDVQYGATRQGSGDQKPAMDSDDVASVVKAIKEANAIETGENTKADEQAQSAVQNTAQSTAQNTAQSTAQSTAQNTAQNTDQSTQEQVINGIITEDDAVTIAITAVGWGLPNQVYPRLHNGAYVVTLTYDGAYKNVTVDAGTGEVLSIMGQSDEGVYGDDIEPIDMISESEALAAALNYWGFDQYDYYTCTIDTSRGYECYNVSIENDGATWSLTINGYTGMVEQ